MGFAAGNRLCRSASHETAALPILRWLDHIGEPSRPPPIAAARGPPEWELEEGDLDDQQWDVPVDPQPEFNFDQTVSW